MSSGRCLRGMERMRSDRVGVRGCRPAVTTNYSIDEVFRTEWSRVVAVLVRDFGDLELAEDCAQDAFMKASERWGSGEAVPDRPGAWLTTTARRKAIDVIRRSSSYDKKLVELEVRAKRGPERSASGELIDDQLNLLLGCCHPALNLESQVALTLRLVAGLTTQQIARGFLLEDHAMGKRISRAKAKVRQAGIPFDPVDGEVLRDRLSAVQHVIYLIFTEGHSSRTDAAFVRGDLCDEAAWLAELVTQLVPDVSEVHGLRGLILLTDARRSTRIDDEGLPVLLADQDRSEWNTEKIDEGLKSLATAVELGPLGAFGLQALLASFHATATSFASTDWSSIVRTYDQLLRLNDSPVVELNRAVAVSCADGPEAGLEAMEPLRDILDEYPYLHSASAELLRRIGDLERSAAGYRRALACTTSAVQRQFLEHRLASLDSITDGAEPG